MISLNATTQGSLANTRLIQARLPGEPGLYQIWAGAQGLIQAIEPMAMPTTWPDLPVLDMAGDWLSLGGVDLQINGALGLAFPDLTPEQGSQLEAIGRFLWQQGVDGFLPTLVTTSIAKIHQALETLATFTQAPNQPVAQVLGVHLEGPFLNPEKRGAHPAAHLRPLTLPQVQQLLGTFADQVKIMTLAPELDPGGEVIAYLRSQDIVVSLGHSLATAAQAQQAFDRGASMVTHAFNAMPSLHHREPGLLGAALLDPQVWCGVIADGEHVAPLMLKLLLRTTQGQGFFLVSDALAPLGLGDGVYPWDTRQIQVIRGTARLGDGTLAGTTLPLLAGVVNLVQWDICSVETAIALATEAPRRALGLPGLGPGQSAASLLRWHQDSATGALAWQRLLAAEEFPQN
jgi:N-acetylglucosamine-6-phosphate deacetylase